MTQVFDPNSAVVFAQPSGPSNPYKSLPPETTVSGVSGGGYTSESDWSKGIYQDSRVTSDPDRFTGTISTRFLEAQLLTQLGLLYPKCYFSLLALYGCSPQAWDNFQFGLLYLESGVASNGFSSDIVKGMTNADDKTLQTLDFDAAVVEIIKPMSHGRIGATTTTGAVNDILPIGSVNCAGACGYENNGQREFIAVGAPVSPALIPRIFYSGDDGNTIVSNALAGITDGVAVAVALYMRRVIIAVTGTSSGIYTVKLDDIKAVQTQSAQLASGITAGTDAPNDVFAIGNIVFAVGAAGKAWYSTNGGFSFTLLSTGIVTALSRIGSFDENLIWFGGAAGALFRYKGGTIVEAITIPAIAGDITAIAVPNNKTRTNEVYVGTSTGVIWRTRNARDAVPTWEAMNFDKPASSSIVDLKFAGAMGCTLWVVQSNGSTQSRVLYDLSGGNLADTLVPIGTFTSPTNSAFTQIAPTGVGHAWVSGLANAGQGYFGRISQNI